MGERIADSDSVWIYYCILVPVPATAVRQQYEKNVNLPSWASLLDYGDNRMFNVGNAIKAEHLGVRHHEIFINE